jgi:hypothetical protein
MRDVSLWDRWAAEAHFMSEQMFGGIPDPAPSMDPTTAIRVGAVVVLLVCGLFLAMTLATPSAIPWSVTAGKLQIHARVWSDEFPLSELQLDQTRTLDLNQDPGWRPQQKSWGVNGFGLNAGRFRLRNGKLADLYLAKETTAVLIPRQGNVPVIIGVRDPLPFLAALKNSAQ